MTNQRPNTRFTGKTSIFAVQAAVFGSFGVFSLVLGPLFLFEIMKDARGEPAVDAGIALSIMSVPMLVLCALAAFNLRARRRPLLCICREGLEINLIGSSSLDEIPLVPGTIRVAWLVLTLQGFKQENLHAPWESFHAAEITGLPMVRTLTIYGNMYRVSDAAIGPPILAANQVSFRDAAFDAPLDDIAETINGYFRYPEARHHLPTWRA